VVFLCFVVQSELTMISTLSHPQTARPRAGDGRVRIQSLNDRSVVTSAAANSPLKLLTPRNRNRSAWIFTSTYGGGLLGGDSISLDVDTEAGTRCLLSTQASTKIYKSDDAPSRQRLNVNVGAGAVCVSAPDPIVCFEHANYEQSQTFELEADASLLMIDSLTSGRRARGERWAFSRYESHTRVRRSNITIFDETIVLDAADGPIGGALRMGRCDCFATMLMTGPALEAHAKTLLAEIARSPIDAVGIVFGASPMPTGAIVRVAGNETEAVMKWIHARLGYIADLIGEDPWARKW
jgi:urease accessory protein